MRNLRSVVWLLCLPVLVVAQPEVQREWTSFAQMKDASFLKKKVKFKLMASSKVSLPDSTSWAGLWARVDNKEGGIGFFDNMHDRPIKSGEWRTYAIDGEMNENSDKLHFGGIGQGNGRFYFDDFVLMVENTRGAMERVSIENPGFEIAANGNEIPHWVQGIAVDQPVHVKGFSLASSAESASGKHAMLIEGKGVQKDSTYYIGPRKGFTTQIGVLVSMLNNLSSRVESRVATLSQKELDFLMDSKANSIGALIMHLAAAEVFFQVNTFENRGFNEEEKKKWQTAFELGDLARKEFIGHDVGYYLEIYHQVRQKTLEELRKRNDDWLLETPPGRPSNYYAWFHVMEHQSSHLGQILLLKKRLPKQPIPGQKIEVEH